ncbi:MAG TPA: sigma-70 family RNA polymerase sigma factor [Steroidobacteraceae bacterium]|nr:sigma-70 family RNA polymerase sigma factor [Steroidobacteraceae bacterium]
MRKSGTEQFDVLVAPHLGALFRVAYRLVGNTADAQDLVQDTCIAACENPVDLDTARHPVRWLLRVLHNRFIDGARRRKRTPVVALEEVSATARMISSEPGPEAQLVQDESERLLHQAFLQLDPMQRTLLSLRAEGHDLAEIEAITGVGRDVLRARLHRARRSLAQQLNTQAAEPHTVRAGSHA